MSDEQPPFVRLSVREGARTPDDALFDGIPNHLREPLASWTSDFIRGQLAERVALRMRVQPSKKPGEAIHTQLVGYGGNTLLDVVDAALQLDARLHREIVVGKETSPIAAAAHSAHVMPEYLLPLAVWPRASERARKVEKLDHLLVDAGSVYRVDWTVPALLVRRVDPSVQEAADLAVSVAPLDASEMLRRAWRATYGRNPDPNTAYREAVRAVEEVACPIVRPNGTLGTVIAHLRDAPGKWEFVLVDKDGDGSVEPLRVMMERLWQGQHSRHGGGDQNWDQTQAEAEAAVQLATTLVHLLSTGTLTPR